MKTFKEFLDEQQVDEGLGSLLVKGVQKVAPAIKKGVEQIRAGFTKPSATRVYRVDDRPIKDFNKNIQTYASKPDGSESGKFAKPQDIPSDWTVQKGLYGTTNKPESVGYAFPRGTKNTTVERPGKRPTMVINKRPPEGHTPTVSTFERTPDWKQTTQRGTEVFSKTPGKPVSQETITNPMKYAKDQGVRVIVGDPSRYKKLAQKILANKSERQRSKVRITGED
jgi:hypothetical protein